MPDLSDVFFCEAKGPKGSLRHEPLAFFGRIFLHWPSFASDGSTDKRETYGFAAELPVGST